jgi:alpha/beta superfamily hydrolase
LTVAQHKFFVAGPAGRLEVVAADPGGTRSGIALIAHPHPLHGGTMENKVVVTLAKAFVEMGYVAVRANFRGVGQSEGGFAEGLGETEDILAVAEYMRGEAGDLPFALAGFSFGGAVQTRAAQTLSPRRMVLVAPAVSHCECPAAPEDTLVIHGELDDVVPLADVLDWARPQDLPITVVPGGDHFFHKRLLLLKRIVLTSCRC